MEIKEAVRDFIEKELNAGEQAFIRDDDPLMELGIIDSMKIFRLLAHLESTFGVDLRKGPLNAESFNSIESIAEFVRNQKKE